MEKKLTSKQREAVLDLTFQYNKRFFLKRKDRDQND